MKSITPSRIRSSEILISASPSTNLFRLREQVSYKSANVNILIPEGFVWDGASIPRAAWLTTGTPFEPDHLLAGLIHDYLYRHGRALKISRETADEEYRMLLKQCGKGSYTRWKEFWALRLFGKKNYQ